MRRVIIIIISVCMMLFLGACATTQTGKEIESSENSILVGCILPLSGTSAYDGESAMNGAKVAAKYINDNGENAKYRNSRYKERFTFDLGRRYYDKSYW